VGPEEEEEAKTEKPKYDDETQLLIDGRYTCLVPNWHTELLCLQTECPNL
jgi:hypothetical protein